MSLNLLLCCVLWVASISLKALIRKIPPPPYSSSTKVCAMGSKGVPAPAAKRWTIVFPTYLCSSLATCKAVISEVGAA